MKYKGKNAHWWMVYPPGSVIMALVQKKVQSLVNDVYTSLDFVKQCFNIVIFERVECRA